MLDFLDDMPLRRLRQWQTYLNIAITACAFASIALSFAAQGALAIALLVPMALLFVAAILLARKLFQINGRKRAEVLARAADAVEPELRELLDGRDPDSPAAQLTTNRPVSGGRWGGDTKRGYESNEAGRRKR